MAQITKVVISFDDGSVQEVDSVVIATSAPTLTATSASTITEVDVKESDGSEVVATPEAPVTPAE